MTNDEMAELLRSNGVCAGDPTGRQELARRIHGFGITPKHMRDALWFMSYTGLKNFDAQMSKLADAGMEALQDYCESAKKVRDQKADHEPGAGEREDNMERRAKIMSGRTFEEKLAAGIPIEQWSESERQRYEWYLEDEEQRREYIEKFGDGKIQ